ncbi:MAG: beta-lactamase family protein [Nitrosomonas sp.]|nr:beta-lactamase family protein [Nitrosomonas sp.]
MAKPFVMLVMFVFCLYVSAAFAGNYKVIKPESVGLSTERLERLTNLIDEHVEEKKIAGSVILIARQGKIAYFKETGLADTGKPMKKDTIFRIVSMTKPITSTAIMLLYEEGKLLLSDPMSKYIPEFKNQRVIEMLPNGSSSEYKLVPVEREVTIHDMLTHQSGILYMASTGWFPNPKREQVISFYREAGITDGFCRPDESIGDMVKRLAKLPLYTQPGEAWEYSLSLDVLGYLVEVISSMPFDEFVQTQIFDPLKMTDSHFYIPEDKLSRLAADWETDWNGKLTRVNGPLISGDLALCPDNAYETEGKYLSGGASVLSTAYDYSRFAQMFLNQGELDGVRLLSRKTVELMTATNHIGDHYADLLHSEGWKFGLGFAIQQDRSKGVDSGDVGVYEWAGYYSTRFSVNPKEETVTIFLSQTSPFDAHFNMWDKVISLSTTAIID